MKVLKLPKTKEKFIEDWAVENLYHANITVGVGTLEAVFITTITKTVPYLKFFSTEKTIYKKMFCSYDNNLEWWVAEQKYLSELERLEGDLRKEFPEQKEFNVVILDDLGEAWRLY